MSWPGQEVTSSPAPTSTGPRVLVPNARAAADAAAEDQRTAVELERLRLEQERVGLQRQQALMGSLPAGTRLNPQTGEIERIPGERPSRPLPENAANDLESQLGIYSALTNARRGFQDDFGGNAVTGALENTLQGVLGTGTPGQRAWWSRFQENDNIIRNQLFGAALTATEQAAFERTTITPRMTPSEIRRNLADREEIVRKALSRRVNRLRAANFNPDEIEAALGEFSGDFAPQQQRQPEGEQPAGPESGYRFEVAASGAGDDPGAGNRLPPGREGAYFGFLRRLDPGDVDGNERAITDWWQQNGNGLAITNARQVAEALRDGTRLSGVNYGDVDAEQAARLEERARAEGLRDPGSGGIGQSVDAFIRGAADVPTLGFADEIAAAGDTIFRGGTMADNLDYQRFIDQRDTQNNFPARFAGQVAGGFALPVGRFGTGVGGAAREGAAFGAGYGFGSGEGDIGDRLISGGVGATAGTFVGGGLGAAIERGTPAVRQFLDNRAAAGAGRRAERDAFIGAAQRNPDVPFMAADIPGNLGSGLATGLADRTLGAFPINRARGATDEALDTMATDTAQRLGAISTPEMAGEAAQQGARTWMAETRKRISDLEDAIPVDGAAPARVDETRTALANLNNEISSNPELAQQLRDPRLAGYQRALESGGLSWGDLRLFRSRIGELGGGPALQSDTRKSALDALYAAMSRDLEATAAATSPRALSQFKRAVAFERGFYNRVEGPIQQILGRDGHSLSGSAAFNRINSWAQEKTADTVRLARTLRSMPAEEAGAVRATIIDRLGDATDSAQNATGATFSTETFLTNWNKLDERAKSILFQGEHRQALDDIAAFATGRRRSRIFGNPSGTGYSVAAGAIGTVALANIPAALMTAAATLPTGALLASPRVARWMAALSRKPNERAARAHIARLDSIARSEPLIAADVLSLQQRLTDAFAGSPSRMAAQEDDNESNGVERRD
ncbi:hypothetical protein UFOVP407_2 [uncultured Caudovirales phage]|uniref:Uncharacterized protein n=1 Tax=uncultured Caudovirales phage TaxID=2100421 RepID=A0A6J5LZL0_9CAUD|nr:hypothetical protein UFOVP407_2 [uncultured Caudovirales phage]